MAARAMAADVPPKFISDLVRSQPRKNSIKKAQSVRVRLDFVILADRAAQRFPARTIPERILPFWFVKHGVTCEPSTWKNQKLDQYIL